MTSDAKIGLLLGLVFIFVIAFVINGLPSFRAATNNNSELTTNMVSSQNESLGLGTDERKSQEGIDWTGKPVEEPLEEVAVQQEDTEDIRFEMRIPDDIAVVENISHELTPEVVQHTLAEAAGPLDRDPPDTEATKSESTETISIELPVPEKTPTRENPTGPEWNTPKVYTISDGDTLATIAKKFYGPEQGNRIANNLKIFEANRKIIESPDKLEIGQKIVIPPLDKAEPRPKKSKSKPESTLADSLFEEVKSIGRKLLPSGDKPAEKPKPKQTRKYVVKDGDYLWKVAERELGDPMRYKDIVKLNPDVLKDENTTLKIGTSLKLPAK